MFDKTRPYVVFGLLQYEHKSSLLNLQITRDNAYEEPVRSKVRRKEILTTHLYLSHITTLYSTANVMYRIPWFSIWASEGTLSNRSIHRTPTRAATMSTNTNDSYRWDDPRWQLFTALLYLVKCLVCFTRRRTMWMVNIKRGMLEREDRWLGS
jgi:hypothetical protein